MAKPKINRNQRRAAKRLARLRTEDSKSLPGVQPSKHGRFTRKERYAILGATRELKRKRAMEKAKNAGKPKEDNYNPLNPLAGKDMSSELDAAEKLEFGPQESALNQAFTEHDRRQPVVTSAYDQYKQSLLDARNHINQAYSNAASANDTAVSTAHSQDTAANAARDKAEADKAAKFGLHVPASQEAAQATNAARTQGLAQSGDIRTRGASSNEALGKMESNSILAKAESLTREGERRKELEDKRSELAAAKGAFRVKHRSDLRESEREWAAIQQEFGLKKEDMLGKAEDRAADRRIERQKLATQRLVARLYSDADKEKARATIRVAKLQLEKGKIDQKQYREIVNIYKGLPEKGSSPQAKPKGKPQLQTWERDKIDTAMRSLRNAKAKPSERRVMIDRLIQRGDIPARLARIAWDRYIKSYQVQTSPPNPPRDSDRPG